MTGDTVALQPSIGIPHPPGPAGRWTTVVLAVLAAVSAVAGGVTLLLAAPGSIAVPPASVLAHTPFASFVVPGLLLAFVVGGAAAVCAVLVATRSRAAIDATLLAGAALSVWIVAELAMLRALSWLHVVYVVLGVALLARGVVAAWRSGRPRLRWLVAVTAAEGLGFAVPVTVVIVATAAGAERTTVAPLLVVAGAVEGLTLGYGQALAFPRPLPRARFAARTALGAACAWACAMGLIGLGHAASVPRAVVVSVAIVAAPAALFAMGWLQASVLRDHAARPRRWIAATALAWSVALPLSLTASPFVDEGTPVLAGLALWICAGLLMAYAFAQLSWLGVTRLGVTGPGGAGEPARGQGPARRGRATVPRDDAVRVAPLGS